MIRRVLQRHPSGKHAGGVLVAFAAASLALLPPRADAEVPVPPPRPSLNLFGVTGLIDTPTAEMQPDAQLSVTSSWFGGYLRNTIAFQALPWFEVSFRYSVLDDLLPGPGETTLYDRSFDLKLKLVEESPNWPAVAVGLQDFLGTGVYSGEYLAATKNLLGGDLALTGGVGWGRFAGRSGLDNPLCHNGNRFCDRDTSSGTGGSVDFGQFFSGEEIGIFGGAEWQTPVEGLALKVEYSDDRYSRERAFGSFSPKTGVNLGAEYRPTDGIEIGAYYMYGTEVGIRLSLTANPFQPLAPVDSEPAPQPLSPRPVPPGDAVTATRFGTVKDLVTGSPVTTSFAESGIAGVAIENRGDGSRWAIATLPPSAGYDCPDAAATAIDAEFGVIDAVSFRHPDGKLVCTVALRSAGQEAIRRETRAALRHPTDWYADEARRRTAVETLVAELEPDRIGLFGIELAAERVTVYIENAKFRAMPRAIGRTARALANTMPASVELFEIVPVENSLPVVSVTLLRSALEDTVNRPDAAHATWVSASVTDAPPADWRATEGTMEQFPHTSWAINPTVPVNLFDPDQPLRLDLAAVAEARIELLPGLSLNGALQKRIVGNLDDIEPLNDSELPRVRSDIARYLREGDPSISRLTADYVTKLDDSLYGRVSAGLLERMFGGIGGELLWQPARQSWGLGGELNWVQQRDFDQLFGFRSYDVVTGHASLYLDSGWHGLSAQLDAGRYLAGDWGGTITLKRRFANGWEVGGFATFTDVPFDEFGEGSFDKGLFLTIPFNWFLPYESRSEFTALIRPLSRDGGQRLVVANRLYPVVEDMGRAELREGWGGFWE